MSRMASLWNFPDDERDNIFQTLKGLDEDKEVIIFKDRRDVNRFLSKV